MVSRGFKQMLSEAQAAIQSISVHDALALTNDQGTIFVDVREKAERAEAGAITGSVSAPRGFLEFIADPESPMHNAALGSGKRLVVFCASGGRSALATKTLMDMGISDVVNLAGGFAAWQEAKGAVES